MSGKIYAVILAGGGGTRLWPLSRAHKPKHLLAIPGSMTLLRSTYLRIAPLIPAEQVLAITVAGHAAAVQGELAELPARNIVVEPMGRSTGPCIGLMATLIQKRDPEAIMISLHADHVIRDEEQFRRVLRAAVDVARNGHLVTMGIVPSGPETAYGYIHRGQLLGEMQGHPYYNVERFAEKPDAETAKRFVQGGDLWNSGIFVWKVSVLLEQFRLHMPELHQQLQAIQPALDGPEQADVVQRTWSEVEAVPVDVGILERATDVAVIPADIGWSDVGCWTSVAEQYAVDQTGNVLQGESVAIDCADSYVHSSGRLVAALGLESIVVIETEDAILVCPKGRVQDVKRIVEQLRSDGRDRYL